MIQFVLEQFVETSSSSGYRVTDCSSTRFSEIILKDRDFLQMRAAGVDVPESVSEWESYSLWRTGDSVGLLMQSPAGEDRKRRRVFHRTLVYWQKGDAKLAEIFDRLGVEWATEDSVSAEVASADLTSAETILTHLTEERYFLVGATTCQGRVIAARLGEALVVPARMVFFQSPATAEAFGPSIRLNTTTILYRLGLTREGGGELFDQSQALKPAGTLEAPLHLSIGVSGGRNLENVPMVRPTGRYRRILESLTRSRLAGRDVPEARELDMINVALDAALTSHHLFSEGELAALDKYSRLWFCYQKYSIDGDGDHFQSVIDATPIGNDPPQDALDLFMFVRRVAEMSTLERVRSHVNTFAKWICEHLLDSVLGSSQSR
jgi:hypothetical protein